MGLYDRDYMRVPQERPANVKGSARPPRREDSALTFWQRARFQVWLWLRKFSTKPRSRD